MLNLKLLRSSPFKICLPIPVLNNKVDDTTLQLVRKPSRDNQLSVGMKHFVGNYSLKINEFHFQKKKILSFDQLFLFITVNIKNVFAFRYCKNLGWGA